MFLFVCGELEEPDINVIHQCCFGLLEQLYFNIVLTKQACILGTPGLVRPDLNICDHIFIMPVC